MKNRISLFFSLALFVAVSGVLLCCGEGTIGFLERTSFFQYNADFLQKALLRPGGLSEYIGQFLAQFYRFPWAGALLLGGMAALSCAALQSMMRRLGLSSVLYPLALIVALFPLFGAFLTFFKQGELALYPLFFGVAWGYTAMAANGLRRWLYTLLYPLFFVLFGAIPSMALYLFALLCEVRLYGAQWRRVLPFAGGWLAWVIVYPLGWKYGVTYISDEALYATVAGDWPFVMRLMGDGSFWLPALLVLLACMAWLRKVPRNGYVRWGLFTVMCGLSCYFVASQVREHWMPIRYTEVQNRCDKALIEGDWDAVLRIADDEVLPSRQMLHNVAIALAMRGELPHRLFAYPVVSDLFLLPGDEGDMLSYHSSVQIGEFYYRLGVSNEAFHGAFQASVMHFDYHTLKRLAELSVARGEDVLAEKYLSMLEETLFYRGFVAEMRAWMQNPQRSIEAVTDGLYFIRSASVVPEMERLLRFNSGNRMVSDYLLCALLLQKDMARFTYYFTRLYPTLEAGSIPKAYEEALVYAEACNDEDVLACHYPLSQKVRDRYASFIGICKQARRNLDTGRRLTVAYKDTYWYFNFFQQLSKTVRVGNSDEVDTKNGVRESVLPY